MADGNNPLPDYYLKLREAFDAQEAVDRFDLTEGKESVRDFSVLRTKSAAAQLDLITYIMEHRASLVRAVALY